MDIVIPTLGRCDPTKQQTLAALREAGLHVIAVVQPHERMTFRALDLASEVFCLPAHINGISATRDYIINDMPGDRHVCMFDDDLHFAVRRDDDRTKFRAPEPEDIREMVSALAHEMRTSPHVSIGAREGGNRVTSRYSFNTRMMRVLAYDRSVLKARGITFAPMDVMEDFHVTLQLLRLGYDCTVLNNWVSNQAGGSDAIGGCSIFRTPQLQDANAHRLAERHPGFVKVVRKMTKTAWGGKERTDVVVQWKQARKAGEDNA